MIGSLYKRPSWLLVGILLLTNLMLAACGSTSTKDDEEMEPAELAEITPEVGFKKRWVQRIGLGFDEIDSRIDLAFSEDNILAASANGVVAMLSQSTGELRWQTDLEVTISGGIGVNRQLVYVGSNDGDLIALNLTDGEEVWRKKTSGEILSAPVSDGALLLVHSFDGKLYGLDAQSGEQRWVFQDNLPLLTMRGSSKPVIYEELILMGQANGKLIALDKETGQLRWERRVAIAQGKSEIERIVDVDATPLVSGGGVYAVSYQGRIVAFEVGSGRPEWQASESSHTDMATGFGNVYVVSADSSMTAYAKSDGSVVWRQSVLHRRQITAPSIIKSYLVTADYEGYLHLLSQVDGHLVARRLVDSRGVGTAVLTNDDMMFVLGDSGKLVAYQLDPDAKFYRFGAPVPQRDEVMRKPGMFPHSRYK